MVADEGAQSTKGMAASAGRSSYVPAQVLKMVPDPGALGVAYVFRAIAQAM